MEIYKEVNNVKTKEEFINFLEMLANDYKNHSDQWENKSVEDYLESIKSWIEDMDGYYENQNLPSPTNIEWNFLANVFYVGKIYE